jgi:tetratricopeptide (TPR) repeat protein
MNISNYQFAKDEILKLIKNDMISSAEILCSLLLSSLSTNNKTTPTIYSEIYELFGDILFEKGEIKRSLNNYNQAMQQLKLSNLSRNLQQKVQNRFKSQSVIENDIEATIRYKEVKCLLKLNETTQALSDLESIPSNLRNIQILMTLGKLYKNNNRKREAIKIYKEVISNSPTCIEAFEELVSLGLDMVEFTSILDEANKDKKSECLFYDGWIHTLLSGLVLKRNNEYEKSETHFLRLISAFPKNVYILTGININYYYY